MDLEVYGVDADQFLELRTRRVTEMTPNCSNMAVRKLLLKLMNDVEALSKAILRGVREVQVVGSAVMAFRQICILPKDLCRL